MRTVARRMLLRAAALGVAAGGCTSVFTQSGVSPVPASPSPGPISLRLSARIRLHMFQTGWVAVKQEHRSFSSPGTLRLPAIIASAMWTEWLPITAYVIEHPEGLNVVDTGETAQISNPNYAACDPIAGLFYRKNLKFLVEPKDEIGPQMARAGMSADRVRNVVMTHLHSDHMCGMGFFPKARFWISAGAVAGHSGALMCRIPAELNIKPVHQTERAIGVFAQSMPLTKDGTLSLVPTPGHANGHQSVLIQDQGTSLCLVGDAAFTVGQIQDGTVAGIVENHRAALDSAMLLKLQMKHFQTVMLPTHDPGNVARLADLKLRLAL
ncbi:MAG: MBL fold metallo-hydrolase [Sedimentitalea sp.]